MKCKNDEFMSDINYTIVAAIITAFGVIIGALIDKGLYHFIFPIGIIFIGISLLVLFWDFINVHDFWDYFKLSIIRIIFIGIILGGFILSFWDLLIGYLSFDFTIQWSQWTSAIYIYLLIIFVGTVPNPLFSKYIASIWSILVCILPILWTLKFYNQVGFISLIAFYLIYYIIVRIIYATVNDNFRNLYLY